MSDEQFNYSGLPFSPWVIRGHVGNYLLCGGKDGGFLLATGLQPDLANWLVKNGYAEWDQKSLAAKIRDLVKAKISDESLVAKMQELMGNA